LTKHTLEVDSILKAYNNTKIVSDVYLKLETNQIIGILGRNGSGKSTLLKIIFGIIAADNKFIRIDGVLKSKNSDLLNEVSYLSQENFIPKHFSVRQAIVFSIESKNLLNFFNDDAIKSIIEMKINQLSNGELRYLEIKIILNNSSKFLLLDEPFNGLSPLQIDKIITLLKENSSKKGIIITDHNYQNVIEISTRIMLMKSGKLIALKDKNQFVELGYLSS
jgi:ABC-type multidrug transport system ATPase subunit